METATSTRVHCPANGDAVDLLDRFRSWLNGEGHTDVDLERTSAEVIGRVEACTERLQRALDDLESDVQHRDRGDDT